MDTPAQRIIQRLGGISSTAKALGHRHASTVQGWWERGLIPAKQIPNVIRVGNSIGIPLDYADFFESLPNAAREDAA